MTQTGVQLAQVNIRARARGETTDPVMAEFVARLAEINALAEQSPGFVWRLQTEDGDATAVRRYEDRRIMVNLSVWADLAALKACVFRSAHAAVMRRRREWFERFERVYVADPPRSPSASPSRSVRTANRCRAEGSHRATPVPPPDAEPVA
jgi:heme-degrading monooxygenase HmoA